MPKKEKNIKVKSSSTVAEPDFKKEKDETVPVKTVLKDERTHRILGAFILLIGIFLLLAMISYIFTWQTDQDKVAAEGAGLLTNSTTKVDNMMGTLGAYIAYQLMHKGFGIAALLISTFFLFLGLNLFSGKRIFSIKRNIQYIILGLPIISLTCAVLAEHNNFNWGGAFGNLARNYLYNTVGYTGTLAIIGTSLIAYIIWRFNPKFKVRYKQKNKGNPIDEPVLETDSQPDPSSTAHTATDEAINSEKENGTTIFPNIKSEVEEDLNEATQKPITGNQLLHALETPLHINPIVQNFEHSFEFTEKADVPDYAIQPTLTVESPQEKLDVINEDERTSPIDSENGFGYIEPTFSSQNIVIPEPEIQPISIKKTNSPTIIKNDLELKINNIPSDGIDVMDDNSTSTIVDKTQVTDKVFAAEPYDPSLELRGYQFPSINLLENHGSEKIVQDPQELEENKNQIITTLRNYDIEIQRISATVGPTVTLYEIVPAPGIRISRIKNLEDDIALSLAALGIRIIAPIPGKGTIGIEVPNKNKTIVSMRTLLSSDKFVNTSFSLPIAIGKKIDNENFIVDLATMPHLLMAGATGQGKSVGLNAILVSLLYKKHPSQIKFVLVDPKKVELSIYKHIENHFLAKLPGEDDSIITDTKKVVHTLNALCIEMDNRYELLKEAGCRNIKEYNQKFVARKLNPQKGHQYLPFIVLVIDEFADLIMTAGKEVELPIARLAQLARAIGIHLIIATQRPSVNIITGTIKANFPARIAFKVSSKIDSRTILDTGGAEQLIGKGDMLISYNGDLVRLQCAFVDTPEVDGVVEAIAAQKGYPTPFLLPEYIDEKELEKNGSFDVNDKDDLFEDAARLIVATQSGSTSLIQRKMKLGYNRAGRLMDQLEAAGIVGPTKGSKVREVLVHSEVELEQLLHNF